jgi:hypothetical protein
MLAWRRRFAKFNEIADWISLNNNPNREVVPMGFIDVIEQFPIQLLLIIENFPWFYK